VEILQELKLPSSPRLLQSFENGADSAVYQLDSKTALVFSVDFFTPVVNDPYTFGQIAVANALSDIYVTGAKPILALNLIAFPKKGVSKEILKEILKGGASKLNEAGVLLGGGHSIDDPEPKYGIAVVGIADPEKLISNRSASKGDLLYLTKPLGTGILITAYKGKLFDEESPVYFKMVKVMTELNDKIADVLIECEIKTATDITGFGLVGHALEMAFASKKTLIIHAGRVPFLEEAREFLSMGIIPEGDYENLNFCKKFTEVHPDVSEDDFILLVDAQTSGGFLIAVPEEKKELFEKKGSERGIFAKLIGKVEEGCPQVKILP